MATEEPYWTSDEGLTVRLKDLADHIEFRTFNGAIQVYAANSEVHIFEWVTDFGENTCDYCDSQSGRRYRKGQFMPSIPVHIKCHCFWDVLVEDVEL